MHQSWRLNNQTIFLAFFQQSLKNVYRTDKLGAVARSRMLVDLFRFADLDKFSTIHDRNTTRHRHGFFLIVRHHHAGHTDAFQDIHYLQLHAVSEFFIQRPHWFIQQQQFWTFCQAARQCHALTLAARKLMWFAFSELLHMHESQHLIHPTGDFSLRQFVLLETKGNVLLDSHMRKQGVGLKHHINWTQIRRDMR